MKLKRFSFLGNISKPQKSYLLDQFGLAALLFLLILIVNPIGDFPLNDDWSFAETVANLLKTGSYIPTDWTCMTLFSHVLWGAGFASVFEFSHTVLRISTLVLALVTLITIYSLLRNLTNQRWFAIFISLLVLFNPLFFSSSFTFMTDVPFAAFSMISILFFIKYLQKSSTSFIILILGIVFTTIAVLNRQIGLFIPLAFAVSNTLKHKFRIQPLLHSILSFSLPLAIYFYFNHWLDSVDRTPLLYNMQIEDLTIVLSEPLGALKNILINSYKIIMYLGLFLLPISLIWMFSVGIKQLLVKRLIFILLAVFSIITITAYIVNDSNMPYYPNVFQSWGIGPQLLINDSLLEGNSAQAYFRMFSAVIINGMSILGSAIFVSFLIFKLIFWMSNFNTIRKDTNQLVMFFFLVGTIIYFGPIFFLGAFDRYFIIPVILMGMTIVLELEVEPGKIHKGIAISILSIFSLYSVLATHDYLSWNRVRWDALETLLNDGIEASEIHGGFEFNAKYCYDPHYPASPRSPYWVIDDKYVIAFQEIEGYKLIDKHRFPRWFPSTGNYLYVLIRNESLPN